ncbi:hypothetical protein BLNAU_14084 [Blattamonas nauphoetae]|uniref:Uncharacterized protein n=1 Tax=Blattamonas nauphoetae TaxID=2049346 RepID=A0ABQ9XEV7_9EUKA|nr:hypothetical protein BLNAU_14084 [Blattamonas nauphoetae]
MVDPEYSPFLNWTSDDFFSVASIAQPFLSLISMVRDDVQVDDELARKTSKFLDLINQNLGYSFMIDDFMKAIGQGSSNPAAVFVDSVIVLLSSSHPSIIGDVLTLIYESLRWSLSTNLAIISNKLIPRIFSTPHLRDLSVVADKDILKNIINITHTAVQLLTPITLRSLQASTDTAPLLIRDVVLHEVLIPIEPTLVQINRNRRLFSWSYESRTTLHIIYKILESCVFHQPTLDFLCTSHITMVFQSLLTEVELEYTHKYHLWCLSDSFSKWRKNGAEISDRWKILLQTLEREGFRDGLEQTLHPNKTSGQGRLIRVYSLNALDLFGINSIRLE